MKTYSVKSLTQTALRRKPGYLEACMKAGMVEGDKIEISEEDVKWLRENYALPRELRG